MIQKGLLHRDKFFKRVHDNEQGAVLVASALIFGVLIFFVIAFAVDDSRVKAAAIDLRAKTDSICKAVAYEPMWQRDAYLTFGKQVNFIRNRLLFGADIVDAKIGLSSLKSVELDQDIMDCQNCRWYNYITDSEFSVPVNLWTQDLFGGNLVACEIEAKIGGVLPNIGWFGDKRTIKATSLWSRPVFTGKPFDYGAYLVGSIDDHEMPALSIAVATQMTTSRLHDRFLFDDPIYDDYNPLEENSPGGNEVFSLNSLSHTFNPENIKSANAITGTDLEEMLVACMNPPVLVRNALLSMIVELSARHGFLRRNTSILSINSRDEFGNFDYVAPALISSFGSDLAMKRFQHPFVSYPAGRLEDTEGGSTPGAFGQPKGRGNSIAAAWLNPFDYVPPTSHPFGWEDSLIGHHSLVAGQLRFCHQLYRGSSTIKMLDRFDFSPLYPILEYSGNFLPSEDGYQPNLSWPTGGGAEAWDISDPWSGCLGDQGNSVNKCLTAAQVVASLGTTQSCPYEQTGLPIDIFPTGSCLKPPIGSGFDLEPDVLSTMLYLTDENMHGLKSPGVGPLDPVAPVEYPLHSSQYTNSPLFVDKNTGSHILFVTHQPIRTETERDAISNLMVALEEDKRPVTIIYIPTSQVDVDDVDTLIEAFGVSEDYSGTESQNRLYVFSPYEDIHQPGGDACENDGFCFSITASDEENFRDYWQSLLDPHQKYSIQRRAKAIFLDRILEKRLKM